MSECNCSHTCSGGGSGCLIMLILLWFWWIGGCDLVKDAAKANYAKSASAPRTP